MNVIDNARPLYPLPDPGRNAVDGIREQLNRLERNVSEIASTVGSDKPASDSSVPALLEQHQIVNAVRANARSLEAANQTVGTILDIKV